ncbi:MAG: hypothetical protein U9N12_05745, partial [Euryarchaeota archaeon]|nr:hypothetical protein [Euryarchaeota archaeon]
MIDGSRVRLSIAAESLAREGQKRILLSGGSRLDGSVPTYELSDEIRQIKDRARLLISAHTGIVNQEQAKSLAAWLDMALVDCIGSDRTISEILGLPNTVGDYVDTLKYLTEANIPGCAAYHCGAWQRCTRRRVKSARYREKIRSRCSRDRRLHPDE